MIAFRDVLHYYNVLNKELGLSLNWDQLKLLPIGTARYLRSSGISGHNSHTLLNINE